MKAVNLLITIVLILLLGCQHNIPAEDINGKNCFNNDPIHEYSWLNVTVNEYTQPKSGFTQVVVYEFKNEYYVAVENNTMSSPGAYIFNCTGNNIGVLSINYNDFYDSAKQVKVLLEGKY